MTWKENDAMFCDACGTQLSPNQAFCANCGKPVRPAAQPLDYRAAPVPVPPALQIRPRVEQHSKVLAVLWIAYSLLHLLPGIFLMTFFQAMREYLPPDVPQFVPPMLQLIGLVLSAASILGLIAGWGLLTWKPWARMLTIVLGIVHLINIPFGTAIGVYTLWVLLPSESEQQYHQRVAQAGVLY
jgi:hypothetical protein